MAYELERERFASFRRNLAARSDIKTEMERAIGEVLEKYNTAVRENRFVVGGILEHIVGTAMRACDIPVQHRGASAVDFDLRFEDAEAGYSIKSIFRASSTRLVNILSVPPTHKRWRTATIFLVRAGLVYADPSLSWWQEQMSRCVIVKADALEIKRRCVLEFADSNPEWLIPCDFPGISGPAGQALASADAAVQILRKYPALFAHLPSLVQ